LLGAAETVFVLFLVLLEVLVAFLAVLAVLAEGPAGEAALVAWAANVRGMVAKANAIVANSVFFIFFLPAGPSPAYISILRPAAFKLDSPDRLSQAPKSGL
jgi:hypothetical protein